jgi:sugar/nucleoside kinase (ribokinase family)
MKYDITMIGHISRDIMIYGGEEQRFTGGPVIYSSIAAARSGKKVHVITKCSAEDDEALDVMRENGVEVTRQNSALSTSIENIYLSEDRERRHVRLISQADPFSVVDFPETSSRIYHMAGLFRGEIPDDFIPFLAEKGKVGIDAQGLLRCSEEGKLLFRNWDRVSDLMNYITYFKADAAEAEILTGEEDREKAADILHRWGADEVILTHNNEVIVRTIDGMFRAPFTPSNLSGRTGRGDTTFAAYMAKRLDADAQLAVSYAAALCSIKMENPGPFSGTLEDVLTRMERPA